MKRLSAVLAVALLAGLALADGPPPSPPPGRPVPAAPRLAAYLNDNARKSGGSLSAVVSLDVTQNKQSIGLDGQLTCQGPAGFRLRAKALGTDVVDLGSNAEELWAWLPKASPPGLLRVSRKGLALGAERGPTVLDPQLALWLLGLGTCSIFEASVGGVGPTEITLIERALSEDGRSLLTKVTVFNRLRVDGKGRPQVVGRRLGWKDKEVLRATILEAHEDRSTGFVVPRKLELVWPAERLRVLVTLRDIAVGARVTPERAKVLFSAPPELARARPVVPPPRESVGPPPELAPVVLAVSDKGVAARWGEESFRLATRPDDRLATQLLRDQLEAWALQAGKGPLTARVTWGPGVAHAPLKAVLQACRLAGIRRLELEPAKETTATSRR
jgi:hypothetical protein